MKIQFKALYDAVDHALQESWRTYTKEEESAMHGLDVAFKQIDKDKIFGD